MPQPFAPVRPLSALFTALLSLALLVLVAQQSGRAQGEVEALSFATSYTVTGNYVVAGVDLAPASATGGFVTGTIPVSGVPAHAEIVAAFLYWETLSTDDAQLAGAQFRGQPLTVVKTSRQRLDSTQAACWSSGGAPGAYTMTMHRADVRRLLPVQLDTNGVPTGRRLVNSADLAAAGVAPHTVTLPDAGGAGAAPTSAGASLFVVYRDPAQPLTKVVLYDGIHVQPAGTTTSQTIRGFLQSAAAPAAQLTHIAGGGAANTTDRLWFKRNGTSAVLATDAFQATSTPASNRSWSNPTFTVSPLMPGADPNLGFGEEVETFLTHTQTTPYDCLSWAAIVFSTTVRDTDRDGLIDKLEDVSGLKEPDGAPLPDLHEMGAGSDQRDVFIEVGAMHAAPGTTYGSARAPFAARLDSDPSNDAVTDPAGHNHMPTPAVLKLVGDTLANAPPDAAGGAPGIRLHVDAGPGYHQIGPAYASTDADAYLVPTHFARGGEAILETACVEDLSATPPRACLFPDYPGTVGWKVGFQLYRDARIDADGRRRFDHNRRDLFHYALYAHAGGIPKSPLACLDAAGQPTAAVAPLASANPCGPLAPNPAFRVPTSASGRGDLPGGDFVVTLGLWDNERFVGSDFVQASTTLHELGHNFERWHGGDPPTVRTAAVNGVSRLSVAFEPNCKPNYLSVMSYLFQVNGLVDDNGVRHLDYSGTALGPAVDETALVYGSLPVPLPYRTSWFAPLAAGTLGQTLGTKKATKYCTGQRFPDTLPAGWVDVARIDAASPTELIDWNADGVPNEHRQDVNFDGRLDGIGASPTSTPALTGANDWAHLRLDQIGSRRNIAGFSGGFLGGYVDGGYVDGGYVDGGYVDGGYVDGGYVDGGYVDGGYVDGGYVDGGYVDGGYVDGGYVDGGYVDGGGELTYEVAAELGYAPPVELRACVIDGVACVSPGTGPDTNRVRLDWKRPHAGTPLRFFVYRVQGTTVAPGSVLVPVAPVAGVPAVPAQATYAVVDPTELPDGVEFTYLVKAQFVDGPDADTDFDLSIPSNYATITARSVAPQLTVAVSGTPGPNGWFTSAPVPVAVSATDDVVVAALACSDSAGTPAVNAIGIGTPSASLSVALSGDGTHVVNCTASDGAGNATSAGTTVRIDTVAPVATIVSGPTVSGSTVTFAFTGSDATSGVAAFECRWDAGTFSPCTSPASTSTAATSGARTFAVRAVDVAGNVGTAASVGFSTGYTVTPRPITVKEIAKLGSAVPVAFTVRNPNGSLVTSTSVVTKIDSVYQGAVCPAGSTAGVTELIYQAPNFSTGKSSLRFVSGGFQFNWDTTSAATQPTVTGKGCYVVMVYLNDGSSAKTTPLYLQ